MKTPSKSKAVKRPNQFQRIMIAMEKAGCVRKDGKSTAAEFPSILQSAENNRRDAETLRALQFALNPLQIEDRPESEREILRCAPPFDAQAEHENDLRYESRVDYESWQYDGPSEMEDV